jgi:hypothetical protein
MKNGARHALLSAGIMLGLTVLSTSGHATTFTYVEVAGGSCCVIDTNNKVQVSDTTVPNGSTALPTGVFDILVTLDTNWSFQKNAGDKTTGHAASFAFASSLTNATLTVNTSPFFANSNNPMGAFAMSPYSFPATGYGVSQNTSNSIVYSTLDFLVNTGTTDTLAQFIATLLSETGNSNIIFAADVQDPSTGNTGAIGFGLVAGGRSVPETPLPAALPLFASGAGLLGFLSWRRKRKQAANA